MLWHEQDTIREEMDMADRRDRCKVTDCGLVMKRVYVPTGHRKDEPRTHWCKLCIAAIGWLCYNGHFEAHHDALETLYWIFRAGVPLEGDTPARTPETQA